MGGFGLPFFLYKTIMTIQIEALNRILMSCGQAPVTEVETTNPDVAIAAKTLTQVSKEIQSEGWTFNKEYHVSFPPDGNNEITIASNILQIKLSENSANMDKDAVNRAGKLYDRQNHSKSWTEPVECDVTYLYEWEDLPPPIQNFVSARAATFASQRIVGDMQQYQILQQQEAIARSLALEYETQQGQYTFFGHPQGQQNYYQSYQPYQALKR